MHQSHGDWPAGVTASTSVYQAAVQEDDSTATSSAVRDSVVDYDTENTAPGKLPVPQSPPA